MSVTQPLTVPLDTETELTLDLVGGKGLSLALMTRAGFDVPRGFCLTTDAYRQYVAAGAMQAKVAGLAKPEFVDGAISFNAASQAIRGLFTGALPNAIRDALLAAYATLDVSRGVAVRSSASAEDLPDLSFAGQQETYLNVRGEDELLAAVRSCWASLWTERAIGYRHEAGVAQDAVAMGVVVQQMVPAEVAGTLFTANPVTGERSELIIDASFGLGEAVVGGEITPDTYVVDKATLTPKDTIIGSKERMIVAGVEGTATKVVAEKERKKPSLTEDEAEAIAAMAVKVESFYGGLPQDIEWAMTGGKLFVLQSRPLTNLPPAPLQDVRWDLPEDVPPWSPVIAQRKLSEHIPGPVSPLFEDLYIDGAIHEANQVMHEGFGMDSQGYKGHFTVNGYVYMAGGRPPIKEMYRNGSAIPPRRRNPPTHEQTEAIWRDERVPQYLAVVDKWRKVDLAAVPSDGLFAGIGEIARADATYWFEGFLAVMLIVRSTESSFHGFLEQYGGSQFTSGQFLTGMQSVAMDAETEMWEIVQQIRANADVRALVLTTPARRLLTGLRRTDAANDIVKGIDTYLHKYGHRVQTLDFAEPTLGEDPTNAMLNLQALVQAEDYDPAARREELARKREDAMARADVHFVGKAKKTHQRSRTDTDHEPVEFDLNSEFHHMLDEARRYYYLREAGLHHLAHGWPVLRALTLELGRRLVEIGTLRDADEVFYLRAGQLQKAIDAQAKGIAITELHGSAVEQMELRAARAHLRSPPQIPIPEVDEHQTESRGMGGMRMKGSWLLASVQMVNREGDTLDGYACSPGQVTAEASVILSPADFGDMKPGTVLVCPMTTPAWTHLFSQAVGLVTNVGGILSHGSIVAREYDIPAVLGTGDITDRIRSGQRISVDGTAGVVTILG